MVGVDQPWRQGARSTAVPAAVQPRPAGSALGGGSSRVPAVRLWATSEVVAS